MPTFSLATLLAPLITAIKPSFQVAADTFLVIGVLLMALWAYWSNVLRILSFMRGMQLDKKYAEADKRRSRRARDRADHEQFKKDKFDSSLRFAGIDVDQYHRDMNRNEELRRDKQYRDSHKIVEFHFSDGEMKKMHEERLHRLSHLDFDN